MFFCLIEGDSLQYTTLSNNLEEKDSKEMDLHSLPIIIAGDISPFPS